MKFIADAMLGRLATWMRIIGCDVAYYRAIEDDDLVDLAAKDSRLILTKDTLLIRRRKAKGNFLLIGGNSYQEQLKQVVQHFSIDPYQNLLARCIRCNIPLTEIDREKITKLVPEYVYHRQGVFRTCPECRRIYWPATHRDEMLKKLREILREE